MGFDVRDWRFGADDLKAVEVSWWLKVPGLVCLGFRV